MKINITRGHILEALNNPNRNWSHLAQLLDTVTETVRKRDSGLAEARGEAYLDIHFTFPHTDLADGDNEVYFTFKNGKWS